MDTYPVTRESSTYKSVRDHLNRFSIYDGLCSIDLDSKVKTP